MSIIDDPMLALIIRFVTKHGEIDASNEAFIKLQFETLKDHIAQFPIEKQGPKAMEWIKQHAENYRRNWQQKVVTHQARGTRCKDCPILGYEGNAVCVVHDRWLKLLEEFLADEIDSERYIEEALQLLREHKRELIIAKRKPLADAYLLLNFHTGN
ncbi:MAG: hypothetical protein ABFS39_11030 [Pseudomonadota bacterium]